MISVAWFEAGGRDRGREGGTITKIGSSLKYLLKITVNKKSMYVQDVCVGRFCSALSCGQCKRIKMKKDRSVLCGACYRYGVFQLQPVMTVVLLAITEMLLCHV